MPKLILLWILERCSEKSDDQGIRYIKNNDYVKRLFSGTVAIYFDIFKKCLHFGPKLPYNKSGFSKDESPPPLTFYDSHLEV